MPEPPECGGGGPEPLCGERVESASRERRSRIHLRLLFLLLLLASCGEGSSLGMLVDALLVTSNAATCEIRVMTTRRSTPGPTPTSMSTPTASRTVQLSVQIQLELNDYCTSGTTLLKVLLRRSIRPGTTSVPSIQRHRCCCVCRRVLTGTIGMNAVQVMNAYPEQITGTANYVYTGTHVTSLAVYSNPSLRTDLLGDRTFHCCWLREPGLGACHDCYPSRLGWVSSAVHDRGFR